MFSIQNPREHHSQGTTLLLPRQSGPGLFKQKMIEGRFRQEIWRKDWMADHLFCRLYRARALDLEGWLVVSGRSRLGGWRRVEWLVGEDERACIVRWLCVVA